MAWYQTSISRCHCRIRCCFSRNIRYRILYYDLYVNSSFHILIFFLVALYGLALSHSLNLTVNFDWFIRHFTFLTGKLNHLERLQHYEEEVKVSSFESSSNTISQKKIRPKRKSSHLNCGPPKERSNSRIWNSVIETIQRLSCVISHSLSTQGRRLEFAEEREAVRSETEPES